MAYEQQITGLPSAVDTRPPVNSDPLVDQLMQRVQTLETEKRRWKAIGMVAIATVVLLLTVGGLLLVGVASLTGLAAHRRQEQAERLMYEAQLQQRLAEEQRQQVEQLRQAAEAKKP